MSEAMDEAVSEAPSEAMGEAMGEAMSEAMSEAMGSHLHIALCHTSTPTLQDLTPQGSGRVRAVVSCVDAGGRGAVDIGKRFVKKTDKVHTIAAPCRQ